MADGVIQVPPDSTGKQLRTQEVTGTHQQVVTLADSAGTLVSPATDAQLRATPLAVRDVAASMPLAYDYMSLTYTGDDVTGIVYKVGGAGGTTVATVTMTYSGGKLQTWART